MSDLLKFNNTGKIPLKWKIMCKINKYTTDIYFMSKYTMLFYFFIFILGFIISYYII